MRVISGSARGRSLQAGRGQAIRPTGAKVKGAIFSILASRHKLEGLDLLDLFAGAGGLGIEALSRGARHVTFVESDAAAARILRRNLERCGLLAQGRLVQAPVPAALRRLAGKGQFGGVFLDPPYEKGLVGTTLAELGSRNLVAPSGWVVAEHSTREAVARVYGPLRLTDDRRYGKTALAIFVCDGEVEPTQAQR
jgi:16S rRNA (guanine(966)-N(2))-methyltransferase RsmD